MCRRPPSLQAKAALAPIGLDPARVGGIPARAMASTRFGVSTTTSLSSSRTRDSGSAGAGAGFRMVCIPASKPRRIARIAVSSGDLQADQQDVLSAEQRVGQPVDIVGRSRDWPPAPRRSCSRRRRPRRSGRRPRACPATTRACADVDPLAAIALQRLAAQRVVADGRDEDDLGARAAPRPPGWPPCRRASSGRSGRARSARRGQSRQPDRHVRVARPEDDDSGHGGLISSSGRPRPCPGT